MNTARFLTATVVMAFFALQGKAQQCGAGFTYFSQGTSVVYFQDSSFTMGGDSIINWSWTFGDGNNGTGPNQQHFYNAPGTYTVCLTITTAQGCINTNCQVIVVQGGGCQLSVNVLQDSTGTGLYVTASGGTPPYSYIWSNGATTFSISGLTPGLYCVTVTDANACTGTDCDSSGAPGCSPYFIYTQQSGIVTFSNYSAGVYASVLWDFGDSTTSTSFNPTHTYAASGTYYVCLSLLDAQGNTCSQYCSWVTVQPPANATLCGTVFVDNNNNGIYDSGDVLLSNEIIMIYGGGVQMTLWTDSNGYYSANVPAGTYTISYCPNNFGAIVTLPLDSSLYCGTYTVTIVANQTLCGFNFAVQYTSVLIEGSIYADLNLNGTKDAGEPGIPYQQVTIGGYSSFTNNSGNYSINLPAGTYSIQYTPQGAYAAYALTTPGTISLNATTVGNTYSGNDFGLNIPPGTTDLNVQLLPHTTVTPGFPAWYTVYVCNNGIVPVSADVTMVYDPALYYDGTTSVPAPTVDTVAHTITWTGVFVTPGGCWSAWVDFTTSAALPLGTSTFEFASAFPTTGTDIDLSNNTDTVHQVAVGSWDPNNKLSIKTNTNNPNEQLISSLNNDQEIKYTVNFENTGTGDAVNIVVIDQLSTDLDANSFQLTGSSHPCTVNRTGNQVVYTFSNIMLPPTSINPSGSHGFISFKANAVNGLATGTVISDFANIYFDFNAPVLTGNTHIVMIDPLGIQEPGNDMKQVLVYPNPVQDAAVIDYKLSAAANVTLEIMDMNGRVCEKLLNNYQQAGEYSLNWSPEIQAGVYFVKLQVNGSVSLTRITVLK